MSHWFPETELRLIPCLVLVIVLGASAPAARGMEVLDARVARTAEGYEVDFTVRLAGREADLERLLTDYERFAELSPTVVRSRVLRGHDDRSTASSGARIELKLRPCVLVVFCRTVVKVSDASVHDGGRRLEFLAVPALSDFHEARETVTFAEVPADGASRIRFTYSAFLRPKFFVPPFVGPWLVRHHVIKDLKATSERVEKILRDEAAAGGP